MGVRLGKGQRLISNGDRREEREKASKSLTVELSGHPVVPQLVIAQGDVIRTFSPVFGSRLVNLCKIGAKTPSALIKHASLIPLTRLVTT
jgi:hypothetical protein